MTEMQQDASEMDGGSPAVARPKGGKLRLLTLGDLDSRTRAARQARALVEAVESDLGGAEHLTAGERQLAQRIAVLGALIESMEAEILAGGEMDLGAYLPAVNAQRRLCETVGLKRRARDVVPTLRETFGR